MGRVVPGPPTLSQMPQEEPASFAGIKKLVLDASDLGPKPMAEVACVKSIPRLCLAFFSCDQPEALKPVKQPRIRACSVSQHLFKGLQEIFELIELGKVVTQVVAKRTIIACGSTPQGVKVDAPPGEQI